eukprot:gb/GECH01003066.1/.p1 GENE.gb/GECH01003066.1/~~gb/GECH01003066.1/.p1  ORF type:complete len:1039 (+),score=172.93 gb/GECH01003066.1/:1-3117(+)
MSNSSAVDNIIKDRIPIWQRPSLAKKLNESTDNITFQQFEADYYVGDARENMPGMSSGQAPIVRLYGVSENGNSVTGHVHGYTPYIYIPKPDGMSMSLSDFRDTLNEVLGKTMKEDNKGKERIVRVDTQRKRSILHYDFGEPKIFLRIFTAIPAYVPKLREVLEQGFVIPGLGFRKHITYESDVLFVLRCMIDSSLVGCQWVEAPAGAYSLRSDDEQQTTAQIEFDIAYDQLCPQPTTGQGSTIAPVRVMSFDIECAGEDGHFPVPDKDPVIQIANCVLRQGESQPFIKNVFVLGTCANIVGSDVLSFESESDMLEAWAQFIRSVDPDVITGYNFVSFDLPYMLQRAKALQVKDFEKLGRVRNKKVTMKKRVFSSKAYGTIEDKDISLFGRTQLDVIQAVRREYKLSSYSLNSVSMRFLGEQKEDVHHTIITSLHEGDDESRRRLAVYCVKDALLPLRLLNKLMIMINYIEMARVTGVPMSFLLTRGQQIKVVSQLLRSAREEGFLLPTYKVQKSEGEEKGYEGATVIHPVCGFYQSPIATLDFASLYPSIMMAHNLCYSTLVPPQDVPKLSADQYVRSPTNHVFVKPRVQEGLLPRILKQLLSARKQAKQDMEEETDSFRKSVLNARQLALKISANSVYGFTGAQVGKLPCLEISASVTAFGRDMIQATKDAVEKEYCLSKGYQHDAQVIYGDTDSVMVRFGTDSIEESMRLGKEAARHVSAQFVDPIKLEFEKVYCPFLLMNKKRYAGLLFKRPDQHEYIDSKGIETVRRDNCQLVKNVVNTVLYKILIDQDVSDAEKYVKQTISDLLMNRMDISMLVISKSLSRHPDNYDTKQPHSELAIKMRKRDPASAPRVGDRVAYVIVQGDNSALYSRAEDPIYVLDHGVPIDTQYYLDKQIARPIERIFEPIHRNPQELLAGQHTMSKSRPSVSKKGIAKWAQKMETCLRCRTQIPQGQAVCRHCREHEAEVYQKLLDERNHFERLHSRTWTQCQRCQGSLCQDVLCTARDCPIFYMRVKVRKDLRDTQAKLDRFETVDW